MPRMNVFVPIRKVDEENRIVYGIAAQEMPDRAREVMDYATSKPEFAKWSGEAHKASDGKSWGNLRAMHGKVAAGRLDALTFDDATMSMQIAAKVVDDNEWQKVIEGVYTGFSMGGSYAKRWKDSADATLTRYTAVPQEISLVDRPCIPSATFAVVKADGAAEERRFKSAAGSEPAEPSNSEVAARATEMAKTAGDEKQWPAHIEAARAELTKAADDLAKAQAAWDAANADLAPVIEPDPAEKASNGGAKAEVTEPLAKETPPLGSEWEQVWRSKRDQTCFFKKEDLYKHHADLDADAAVQKKVGGVGDALNALAARVGIEKRVSTPEPAKAASGFAFKRDAFEPLKKYLGEEVWDAARAMTALQALTDVLGGEMAEAKDNGDQLTALRDAITRIKDFIASEIKENNEPDPAMAMAALAVELQKRGSRNSKADMEHLQRAHDATVAAGASCSGDMAAKDAPALDLAKIVDDRLEKRNADMLELITEIAKRVELMEKTPLPLPFQNSNARTVTKGEEMGAGAGAELTLEKMMETQQGREQISLALIKASHANPQRMALR